MAKGTCSVEGCERTFYARSWCTMHYDRMRRRKAFTPPPKLGVEERFWSKVEKTDTCWNWTGGKSVGYGRFAISHRNLAMAHRVSYEWAKGPIPNGMHLDHVCHNPACVNPDHLRPVTIKQNQENHNGPNRDSKSGIRGVFWHKGKWQTDVVHCGKHYYLGRFDKIEDAEAAVVAKRNELFTHNDRDREGEAA